MEIKISELESEKLNRDLKAQEAELKVQSLTAQIASLKRMNKFVEEASSDQILEEILKSLNLISTENTKPLIEQIGKKLEGIKTQEESKKSTEKIDKMRSTIDSLKRDNYELRKKVREGEEEFLRMVPTPNMKDLQSRGVSYLSTP